MPHTLAPTKRVALQFSSYRIDVLLPDQLRVSEALRSVGVDPDDPGTVVVTSDGSPLDMALPAGQVVADGAVLHVSAVPRGRVVPVRDDRRGARPEVLPQTVLLVVASVCGVLATLAAGLPALDATGSLSTGQRLTVTAGLLLAALALALRPAVYQSGRNEPGIVAAALLACGGGATAVGASSLVAGHQLAVVAGFISAGVVAALAAVAAKQAGGDGAQASAALATAFSVAGLVGAVALFLDLPARVVAVVVVSLVPPALRLLPSLALRVPVEYLVDAEHVMREALSVRGGPPRPSPALRPRAVASAVLRGDRLLSAATLTVSAAAVVLVPFVLTSVTGTVERIASLVLVSLVALALVCVPRTARNSLSRAVPRVAAGLTLLELVVLAAPSGGRAVLLAGIAAAVGVLVVHVSAAVGRGRRWVRLSRLADALEGLAVTLSIPAGLVAVGTIELVRSAFSG